MADLKPYLDQLCSMHDHICPRQVLGVRMGLHAGDLLGQALPQHGKQLLALVETDGCFADGVAVATGCWLGHRTMRLVDYGKVALTLVDTVSGRAVRVWPNPQARTRALDYAPTGLDRWNAQVIGYQRMPPDDLLIARPVRLRLSIDQLVSRPGVRATCARCGEEILNEREVIRGGQVLCQACADGGYCVIDPVGIEVEAALP